jgi:nicotinate phosphoribosyltransferase
MASATLLTDRYQLTMLAAYAESGHATRRAVFELFARKLPPSRRYLVACGIGRAVEALSGLRFSAEELAYLDADAFLGPALARPKVRALFESLEFRGRVLAIPEGRICFPSQPLVRVEGTLAEAQLVETLLLSIVNHDTRVASKSSRIVNAAAGRPCFEFGTRRAHEQSAVDAARAAYVAGFSGTSNETACRRYGVPIAGTMAHSFVLAHAADEGEDGEVTAFRDMMTTFDAAPTFLVDTFDTLRGVRRSVDVGGARLGGVRIDSGELADRAFEARKLLDERGLSSAKIFLSDDLDEYRIDALVKAGVPVDSFGVGTMAVTTPDAPSLGGVYKLVAIEDTRGRMMAVQKRSLGKGSSAAPKQVLRKRGAIEDTLVVDGEAGEGEPLLVQVMEAGRPIGDHSAKAARTRLTADLALAGPKLLSIEHRAEGEGFPTKTSDALTALFDRVATDGRVEL